MKKAAEILLTIGIVVTIMAAIIPYADILDEVIENRIYFRCILAGVLFICVGGFRLINSIFLQNVILAVGFGDLALITISTHNWIYDSIETYYYYAITFIVIIVGIILLSVIRLWLPKALHFIKSYRQ